MPTSSASPHLPFGENKKADWYGKDIISVRQFGRGDLEYVFGVAHEMRGMVERVGTFDLLKGKILANLFYEPSTRTSSSFAAAMERLGGSVIQINEVKYSSVAKGESLPDTIRTLESYADVTVLRHPETGSAAKDLGVLNIAGALPFALAPALAPVVLAASGSITASVNCRASGCWPSSMVIRTR